jgi:NAD(P)-dependent dehydrogenase (short-subunit alcohol dehydrogenase family)
MKDTPTALVTGANKGLGQEIARRLGVLGMTVLLGSRDPARGEAAAERLAAGGVPVTPVRLDVTDEESVAAAMDLVKRRYGRLDVLVNNAGILIRRPTLETGVAEMRATFETNVFGVVSVTRAALPLLREAPAPRIVNVASTTASLTLIADQDSMLGRADDILAYASSKTAVTMLTTQYANAFRRSAEHRHIKINVATPGYVATDLNGHKGTRTVEEGARIVVELATLPDDGPSGGFFNDDGAVPW